MANLGVERMTAGDPTGRRAHWSRLLTGVAVEIAADGCRDATPEVIDAMAALFKFAAADVRRREAAFSGHK